MAPTPVPDDRSLLRRLFAVAVDAARPARCLPRHLPTPADLGPGGRLVVIGAGKAAAAMAQVVEAHWPADTPLSGVVVTRYGHALPCARIRVLQAAHPVPDAAGLAASHALLAAVAGLGPSDLVLCLLSGGGSALLPLPLPGLTLEDEQRLAAALLASGAPISAINLVRRHLSGIKGGRLAAACHPARVLTLAISDVPGDHAIDIASGPTVADPTHGIDALAVLEQYGVAAPQAVRAVLESGLGESVKPGDPRLAGADFRLVATPRMALQAAAAEAARLGLPAHILGDALEGEARAVAGVMAGISASVAEHGQPFTAPCVILSGGETTVTVRGQGRGGRNVEFLLALAIALDGRAGVHALACDTDGVDGREEVAGAVIGPDTLARARTLGLHPARRLADNDGHGFFAALGDQVITGPTLTNVNDFRAILIRA